MRQHNHMDYTAYKLTNDIDHRIYVGVTSMTLSNRLDRHRSASKTQRSRVYNHMRELGAGHFGIVKLDEGEGTRPTNRTEARWMEQGFIDKLKPSLNNNRAIITRAQRLQSVRDYQKLHRAKYVAYGREYRRKNKDMLATKRTVKIECGLCDQQVSKYAMRRHERTLKHRNHIKAATLLPSLSNSTSQASDRAPQFFSEMDCSAS